MERPDTIDEIQGQLDQVAADLAHASSAGQPEQVKILSKKYARLDELAHLAKELKSIEQAIADTRTMAADRHDPELQAMATRELEELSEKKQRLTIAWNEATNPAAQSDTKDTIVEIRAGAGGDEAALFAAELFRMYSRYAERQGWKTNLLSASHTGISGLKEVIFEVIGHHVFRALKHESGVHRVQRVPDTEKNGRVHTSTVTVAVVPAAAETDLVIDPKDLKIVTSTASGHGGQSVNTTYSAIRLTHLPTGITVSMQDERSQTQNRLKAMQVLRSRLLAKQTAEQRAQESQLRKNQIGSGDRSEKIRTYNFPQDRVTDHRLKLSLHDIPSVLDGKIQPFIDAMRDAERQSFDLT